MVGSIRGLIQGTDLTFAVGTVKKNEQSQRKFEPGALKHEGTALSTGVLPIGEILVVT